MFVFCCGPSWDRDIRLDDCWPVAAVCVVLSVSNIRYCFFGYNQYWKWFRKTHPSSPNCIRQFHHCWICQLCSWSVNKFIKFIFSQLISHISCMSYFLLGLLVWPFSQITRTMFALSATNCWVTQQEVIVHYDSFYWEQTSGMNCVYEHQLTTLPTSLLPYCYQILWWQSPLFCGYIFYI